MQISQRVPLSELTTFHIGGPARYIAHISSLDELKEALSFAKEKMLPTLVLGGGSNILARDEGYDGLVLKNEITGIELQDHTLIVAAGESWDALVLYAVEHGLWGLENLSGIPGSVGGAVVGGIGAYGAAVGQTLSWVEAYNTNTEEVEKFSNIDCQFGYRTSIFKARPELIVVRAAFALSAEPVPNVSYKDLAARFGDSSLDLPTIRAAVLTIREGKFPDITREGSAGSFFKNLILPKHKAEALKAQYPDMPIFVMPETTDYKVPLAWLFDHVLHLNGVRKGAVRCFERQPLVIVADRGAHASDVRSFTKNIQCTMREKFSLEIEEEVVVL